MGVETRDAHRRFLGSPIFAFVLVLVLGTVIVWLRTPAISMDVVYAEDGRVFLGDHETVGFWPTLFQPYTGYLQFWPRVIVGAVRSALPLEAYPAAVAAACALFTGSVAAIAFAGSKAISAWWPWRVGVAALTVLTPTATTEVVGNAANLHWYAFWGTLWLIVLAPRRWWTACALGALACSAALTEIQTALLLPLFLLRPRDARSWVVRGGLLLGLAAQAVGYLAAPRAVISSHPDKASLLAGWLLDVPVAVFTAPGGIGGVVVAQIGPLLGLVALLPPAAALVVVLTAGTRSERLLGSCLAAYAVVTWFAAVWANTVDDGRAGFDVARATPREFVQTWFSSAALVPSRYSVVPALCLAALIILGASTLRRTARLRPDRRRVAAIAVTALVAASAASFAAPWSTRDAGPSWAAEVAAARARCERLTTDSRVELATAPSGWSVAMTCGSLSGR